MKGQVAIESDIYNAISAYCETQVNGKVYYEGDRPRNSMKEDVCIAVSTATAEQVQEGRAKVNIFVKDIDCGNGRLVKNRQRIIQLDHVADEVLRLLNLANTDYEWKFGKAQQVIQEPDTNEHFININLSFQLINY